MQGIVPDRRVHLGRNQEIKRQYLPQNGADISVADAKLIVALFRSAYGKNMPFLRGRSKEHDDLRLVLLVLLAATIVFHLGLAFAGREVARDQHLGTAVEYAKGQIDLLRPIIIGNNINRVPTPLEFPVWQALTAVLMKMFGSWYGWGNVVSLAFHVSTFWPIFQLGRRMFSVRVAWWAATFYAAQPLTFVWGGTASADGMAGSFAIWFVYLSARMMSDPRWLWWLASVVVACLSATTKAPFFFVAGLTVFFWLLRNHLRSRLAWIQLVSVGLVSVTAFIAWNYHANKCYQAAELPYSELRIGSDSITAWWFGDLSSRLNLKSWIRGLWRALTLTMGSFALVFLPITGWGSRETVELRLWIGAAVASILVFTNLILIHGHYYYIFSAPVALLSAHAVTRLEPELWRMISLTTFFRAALCLIVAGAALFQGLYGSHLNLTLDRYPLESARTINTHTAPTDKLVVWGGGWTVPLLRAERTGVNIRSWDPLQDPQKLSRLKQSGYNKLVLMNPSPLIVAITTVSGSGGFTRKELKEELPPVARDWQILFSSPSVLIVEIPSQK